MKKAMLAALARAQQHRGQTAPNPAVGAVVLDDAGHVIASGSHTGPGKPHAEPEALNQLSMAERVGKTLVVTLEPCCHHGRTPPCTDLIIQSNIKKVVYGLADPNPLVAGKGAQQLLDAGIAVEQLLLPEVEKFYQAYVHWTKTKTPWLRAKIAVSNNNVYTAKDGSPLTITDDEQNHWTHEQRLQADALVTNVRTVINDNPKMNVRLCNTTSKPVFVLDRHLDIPLDRQLFRTAKPLYVLHHAEIDTKKESALESAGAICIECADDNWLNKIGALGFHELWAEVGGTMLKQWQAQQLVDELIILRGNTQLDGKVF